MSRLSGDKQEVLGLIDSILSLIENQDSLEIDTGEITSNTIDFLLEILVKLVPYEKLVDWLSNLLVFSLPVIELGVKGILLAQLKTMSDCNIDPRIPSYLRKSCYSPNNSVNNNYVNNKGLLINISSIDYHNILSVSPLSEAGNKYYYSNSKYYIVDDDRANGIVFNSKKLAIQFCDKCNISHSLIKNKSTYDNVYQLARANDFNAFLWFVIHKAHFKQPEVIKGQLNKYTNTKIYYNENNQIYSNDNYLFEGYKNNLSPINGKCRLTTNYSIKPFKPGDTMVNLVNRSSNYYTNIISLCIKSNSDYKFIENVGQLEEIDVINNQPRDYTFTMVPVSSDLSSANWYVNRNTYFNFLKVNKKERNFYSDFAICNLRYIENVNNISADKANMLYGKLLFSIMPKPFVHLSGTLFQKILFNSDGISSSNGKYSVSTVSDTPEALKDTNGKIYAYEYKVSYSNGGIDTDSGFRLVINCDTNEYYLTNPNITNQDDFEFLVSNVLYECYPGLTVYEFNYDFVMGMQLFDANVIASKIIMLTLNAGLSLASINQVYVENRIATIVKNIIDMDTTVSSDCYFTFDNSKYEKLLSESEAKRANLYPFVNNNGYNETEKEIDTNKFYEQLNKFNDNATANENKYVISQAFEDVIVTINEYNGTNDSMAMGAMISDMIKMLTNAIVDVILSPKIILLILVNRKLMGDNSEPLTIEDFINACIGIIVAIVKEIRDLIIQELLNYLIKILKELIASISDLIVLEKVEYYSRLINQLIKACSFNISRRDVIDSNLDYVDYADIDKVDKPIVENNC